MGINHRAMASLPTVLLELRWTVIEVPDVVLREQSMRAASPHPQRNLGFVDHLEAIDTVDSLCTSGRLEYLPKSLSEVLAQPNKRPSCVAVNNAHPPKPCVLCDQQHRLGSLPLPHPIAQRLLR